LAATYYGQVRNAITSDTAGTERQVSVTAEIGP
jgi:hypothetical protein